jgi:hypothetical protein
MANAAKEEIETVGDDDPRAQWPKNAKACTMANLTKRSLENKVRDKSAKYVYDSSGERHFDPEWLQEVSGVVTETDIEADVTKHVIEQLRRALSDTVKSNKDLLTLATVPAFKAARVVRQENRALRKRCRQLELDRIKSIEAFEAAMTATHDRELAREVARSQEARKDKGFDALIGQLPNLVSQMSGKKKVSGLLESLTTEQKAVLFELLTPAQLKIVTTLMTQADSDEKRSPPAKGTDSPNGASGKAAGDTKEGAS